MGAPCCKASKTNEKAHVENTNQSSVPQQGAYAPEDIQVSLDGAKQDIPQSLPKGGVLNSSQNLSATIDVRPPFVPHTTDQQNDYGNFSMDSVPDEEIAARPVTRYNPQLLQMKMPNFAIHRQTENKRPQETPIQPIQYEDPADFLPQPNKNENYEKNEYFPAKIPVNTYENDQEELVLPLYISPKPSTETELKKADSQGTKNLNFIQEQNRHRTRETHLRTTSTAWLQINYIPEIAASQASLVLGEKRRVVAQLGSKVDQEIRNQLFQNTEDSKRKDQKYSSKSALEIQVPENDYSDYFSYYETLKNQVEKISKDASIFIFTGPGSHGTVNYQRRQLAQLSRPGDLTASSLLSNIKEVLSR